MPRPSTAGRRTAGRGSASHLRVRQAMEQCPICLFEFDAKKHRYPHGFPNSFMPMWPTTRFAKAFTVRCPNCSNTFLGLSLKRFGFVRYSHIPWLLAGFIIFLFVLL